MKTSVGYSGQTAEGQIYYIHVYTYESELSILGEDEFEITTRNIVPTCKDFLHASKFNVDPYTCSFHFLWMVSHFPHSVCGCNMSLLFRNILLSHHRFYSKQ